jgi:hypothetical protein
VQSRRVGRRHLPQARPPTVHRHVRAADRASSTRAPRQDGRGRLRHGDAALAGWLDDDRFVGVPGLGTRIAISDLDAGRPRPTTSPTKPRRIDHHHSTRCGARHQATQPDGRSAILPTLVSGDTEVRPDATERRPGRRSLRQPTDGRRGRRRRVNRRPVRRQRPQHIVVGRRAGRVSLTRPLPAGFIRASGLADDSLD